MISVTFDRKGIFAKQMDNLVKYSIGFVEGANAGKKLFFATFGEKVTEVLEEFIDSVARQEPEALHHVYEWYETGNPGARLFDIRYTVSNLGLSLNSTFRQSTSIKNGSKVPFYNKAALMENGISITVSPKESDVLVFEDGAETVFTKNPVSIDSPGGYAVEGSFERTFDLFVNSYFSQAFLQIAGINRQFTNLTSYKQNLAAGIKVGKAAGVKAGFRWITNVGVR